MPWGIAGCDVDPDLLWLQCQEEDKKKERQEGQEGQEGPERQKGQEGQKGPEGQKRYEGEEVRSRRGRRAGGVEG